MSKWVTTITISPWWRGMDLTPSFACGPTRSKVRIASKGRYRTLIRTARLGAALTAWTLSAGVLLSAGVSASALFPEPLALDSDPDAKSIQSLPLEVTLDLPITKLRPGRSLEEPLAGVLRYRDAEREYAFDVSVTTRGHSRLALCSVPPLKINFKRKQLAASIFEGQNKLKLVTHCKSRRKFYRYLEQEYAVYKSYNAVTDVSFRVRRLQVTYRDLDGRSAQRTRPGFFIESEHAVAARLDAKEIDIEQVDLATLDPQEVTTLGLFQFMIGNTDWSILKGRGGAMCCHNGLLLQSPSRDLWVVPYDFDQAGLINAQYALPADGLGIRSVRQRVFRGLCTGDARLERSLKVFAERRSFIRSQFPEEGPYKRANGRARAYLDDFYTIVASPEKRRQAIGEHCRANPKLWRSP